MKKLMAAVVILLGVSLTSCGNEEPIDIEPVSEIVVDVEDKTSEGEDDPTAQGGS